MDIEKVYDIEKIIAGGYGKTAKELAEEIVISFENKKNSCFDLFELCLSVDGDEAILNYSGKEATYIYCGLSYGVGSNIITNVAYSYDKTIKYGWIDQDKIEDIEKLSKNLLNLEKEVLNHERNRGKKYKIHREYCTYGKKFCMFIVIFWE